MPRQVALHLARALGVVLLLVVAAPASGGDTALPPIGKRNYLLNESNPFSPVKINRAGTAIPEGTKLLKDPVQPGHPLQVKIARPIPTPRPAKPKIGERAGQLRFQKMDVAGHLRRPRVEFTRDLLTVERADEPVSQDFFQKVYEPAQDNNF